MPFISWFSKLLFKNIPLMQSNSRKMHHMVLWTCWVQKPMTHSTAWLICINSNHESWVKVTGSLHIIANHVHLLSHGEGLSSVTQYWPRHNLRLHNLLSWFTVCIIRCVSMHKLHLYLLCFLIPQKRCQVPNSYFTRTSSKYMRVWKRYPNCCTKVLRNNYTH